MAGQLRTVAMTALALMGVTRASAPGEAQIRLGHGTEDFLDLSGSTKQPNIVLVITDDQDLHMDSLNYLPLIKKNLIDQGTLFKRHFCTTAVCCPARATLLTGKAAHNTNVTDVFPPYGKSNGEAICGFLGSKYSTKA